MAAVKLQDLRTAYTIGAADAIWLPAVDAGIVATYSLTLVSSSFVGSITIKALSHKDTAGTPLAIPYCKLYLNGAVSDGSLASTAITGSSTILVPATGLIVVVDCTSFTSGSMSLLASPMTGAAA